MAGTRFDLSQLEQLVRGSSATFRVLAVDACRSGALTRVKGGTAAPPFQIQIDSGTGTGTPESGESVGPPCPCPIYSVRTA